MWRFLVLLCLLAGVAGATPVPKGWKRCGLGLPGGASVDFPGSFRRVEQGANVYWIRETKSAYYLVGVEIDEAVVVPQTYPDFTADSPASAFSRGLSHGWNTSFSGGARVGYFLAEFGQWRAALVRYSGQKAASFKLLESKMIRMSGWKGEEQTFVCPPATGRVRLLTYGATVIQMVVLERGPASKAPEQFMRSLQLPRPD
jgi:hypothetical protein